MDWAIGTILHHPRTKKLYEVKGVMKQFAVKPKAEFVELEGMESKERFVCPKYQMHEFKVVEELKNVD
jgi:hypothetical protein